MKQVEHPPLLVTHFPDSQPAQTPTPGTTSHTPASTSTGAPLSPREPGLANEWEPIRMAEMTHHALPSFSNPHYPDSVRVPTNTLKIAAEPNGDSDNSDNKDNSKDIWEDTSSPLAVDTVDAEILADAPAQEPELDATPRVLPPEPQVDGQPYETIGDNDVLSSPPALEAAQSEHDEDEPMTRKQRSRSISVSGRRPSSNLRATTPSIPSRPSSSKPRDNSEAVLAMLQRVLDKCDGLEKTVDSLRTHFDSQIAELSRKVESLPTAVDINERLGAIRNTSGALGTTITAVSDAVTGLRTSFDAKVTGFDCKLDSIAESVGKHATSVDRMVERGHGEHASIPLQSALSLSAEPTPAPDVSDVDTHVTDFGQNTVEPDAIHQSPLKTSSGMPSPVLTTALSLGQLAAEAEPSERTRRQMNSGSSRSDESPPSAPKETCVMDISFSVEERKILTMYNSSQPEPESGIKDEVNGIAFDDVPVWNNPLSQETSKSTSRPSRPSQQDVSVQNEILSADSSVQPSDPSSPAAQPEQLMDVDVVDISGSQVNDEEVDELIMVESDPPTPEPVTPKPKPSSKNSKFRPPAPVGASKAPTAPSTSQSKTKNKTLPSASTSSSAQSEDASDDVVWFRHGSLQPDPRKRKHADVSRAESVPHKTPVASSQKKKPSSAVSKSSTNTASSVSSKSSKSPSKKAKVSSSARKSRRESDIGMADAGTILKASDGTKRGDGKWPPFPDGWSAFPMITDEVECDKCGGRVHWGCAGVGQVGADVENPWYCPDCKQHMMQKTTDMIMPAPPNRCIRPNCLRRRKVRIARNDGDDERYHVAKIIGRRAVGRNPDESRIFHYLVLWDGWPVRDSTWEPEDHLSHDADGNCSVIKAFLEEARQQDVNLKKRVALIREARKSFDLETGDLINP